jgi:hypothetical protein
MWQEHAPHLKKMVENLGQGHRLNHTREVRDDLLKLMNAFGKNSPKRSTANHATSTSSIGSAIHPLFLGEGRVRVS